jgi:hypothetical protein
MNRPIIHGIGQLSSPLAVVRLGQVKRLVVVPWAAFATDAAALAASTALFAVAKHPLLKALSILTGSWAILAGTKELIKLNAGPEMQVMDGVRVASPCANCHRHVSLAPSEGEALGVKCLYCFKNYCGPCADDHFGKGRAWRGAGITGTMVVNGR